MASYDPWPREPPAGGPAVAAPPPVSAVGDVSGALRVELADEGVAHLERALALRPKYGEAMTYLGLVWRQKSFAYFGDAIAWQAIVDQADDWQRRALAARAGKS
jgi:hypothetical protein